jgi:two-component system, OmpR family, alkaline phosphatase synthesis response regulator PhoP
MKVLVAEDDKATREGLCEILDAEGYEVISAPNGKEALAAFERERPDFVCLDVMMPQLDGYEACREIRKIHADVPVIFISAKSEEIDKVVGLELGADDFITKPFGVKEVVARIRAVTRRYFAAQNRHDESAEPFTIADLEVLPAELRARRGDEVIDLSLRDVKLLRFFSESQGVALDRNTIFNACWGMDYFPSSRTLDQHISQLRKRIEHDPKDPAIIQTVHGVGYRYE